METKKVLSAIGVGVLLVGASALAMNKIDSNGTQAKIDSLKAGYEAQLALKPTEVVKEVPVEKIVTVEKVVPGPEVVKEVDNANLPTAIKFIQDNIDEDINMDYIQFEVDSKIEAESYIRDNMVSLLKDNDFFDDGALLDNFRTSEVSISKIYDAEIMDRDFDNKDLTLKYEVKIKAKESGEDSVYHIFEVIVPFEDSKLITDDIELSLI